jgi:hypothetical protein
LIAGVKKNDAFACGRVVKSGTRIFGQQLKERLPPGSAGVIKDLFAQLLEFLNADDPDRFRKP